MHKPTFPTFRIVIASFHKTKAIQFSRQHKNQVLVMQFNNYMLNKKEMTLLKED